MSKKAGYVGMGRCQVWSIAALWSIPRRVMNSERWLNPVLVTLRSISSPINSDAGNGHEASYFRASTCLVRTREGWPTSMASKPWVLAKGDKATQSPRSWETKRSRKLLARL